jgi:hypothetical protein
MVTKKFEFDAVIKKPENVDSGYIEFPYDVKKEFGGKSRVKVKAVIDGVPYRGSLVNMGRGCHWLGITKEIRKATCKDPGDTVHVMIEEDREERTVEIPDDLLKLLEKEEGLLDYFNKLSYTHRKEYVRWIEEAKKEETRKNRLVKTIEMLRKS